MNLKRYPPIRSLTELPDELKIQILEVLPIDSLLTTCDLMDCSDTVLSQLFGKIYSLPGYVLRARSDPLLRDYEWDWRELLSYFDRFSFIDSLERILAVRNITESNAASDGNKEALLFMLGGSPDRKPDLRINNALEITGYLFSQLLIRNLIGEMTNKLRSSVAVDWLRKGWISPQEIDKSGNVIISPAMFREVLFLAKVWRDRRSWSDIKWLLKLLLRLSLEREFSETTVLRSPGDGETMLVLERNYDSIAKELVTLQEDYEVWGLLEDAYDDLYEELLELELQHQGLEEAMDYEESTSDMEIDYSEDFDFSSDSDYVP